jgi:hypothetical protein
MQYIFWLFLLVMFSSCKKEGCTNSEAYNYDVNANTDNGSCIYSGCIDCNATNFNPEATINDNSCLYVNKNRLGLYRIHDTLTDWTQTKYIRNYTIEIKFNFCAPYEMLIVNYANKHNTIGDSLSIICEIDGDSIYIKSQNTTGPDSFYDNCDIYKSTGYFSNDSIYFNYLYTCSDATFGNCRGLKIN